MSEISHRFIETNGIRMHIAEAGQGPLVLLCHGFPEFWYSWRHQLTALAEAGFHVVAPDQRGYGQTESPESIEAYNIMQLTGDIIGLVNALKEEQAVIVGHDWGAQVASHCALFRPDLFSAVVLLSVPFLPRYEGDIPPTELMKQLFSDGVFYQVYFQEPGKAEADMELDVRKTMISTMYSSSGSAPPDKQWRYVIGKGRSFKQAFSLPDKLPDWLLEKDIEYITSEFERTGFRGGLNWYRNIDFNWAMTPFLEGAKLRQQALYIGGERDGVLRLYNSQVKSLEQNVPNLKRKIIVPHVGHWINQEQPQEINRLLIQFLTELNDG
jgi:pimeloyl-ACP methyl ester carboxylesterase